ncbi:MAG: hypothetical protein AAF797_10855 [Planctomycetota bacterium]
MIFRAIHQVDEVLRGRGTVPSELIRGELRLTARPLLIASVVLAMSYGVCMSVFALVRGAGSSDAWIQLLASTVKLPVLFLATFVVTLPSLYVFNVLMGAKLSPKALLRLIAAMGAVILAVLASFGPIVAFFSVSTTSYPFMIVLNVTACGIAGVLGLAFLLRTLGWLVSALDEPGMPEAEPDAVAVDRITTDTGSEQAGLEEETTGSAEGQALAPAEDGEPARDAFDADRAVDDAGAERDEIAALREADRRRAKLVFRVWVVIFSLVGAQMSWVLRPFIGHPGMPFTWFRNRESNFFLSVLRALGQLLGG